MSATVHGAARYGITADTTATGLHLGDLSYDYNVEIGYAKNHIGENVAMALYNDMTEVSFSGVVAVKATGFVLVLGAAITLANESVDSFSLNDQNLMSTPVANAGTIITGLSLKRMNSDFETGDGKAIFNPQIATNAPTTVS
jgi:hypothetical protein